MMYDKNDPEKGHCKMGIGFSSIHPLAETSI
jgi:hypothetical protein